MGLLDGWRFCPLCAGRSAASRASSPASSAQRGVGELGARRAGARRARRPHPARPPRDDPAAGLWDIPGGFVEEHEHPLEALRRELREETGLEIEPSEFLGMWMQPYDDRNVLCSPGSPARRRRGACRRRPVELRWFAPDELPADELAFESFVRSCHSGARGTSTRSAPGSIRNSSGVSSSTGSPSTAARIRGQRRADLELGAAPLLPGDPAEAVRDVEVQLALVEALALAEREQVEAVVVVGDEHEPRAYRLAVDREPLPAAAVLQGQRDRAQPRERVAAAAMVLAPVHEPRVEAERDVVQEEPVADAPDVDAPLDAVVEGGERRRADRRGRGRGRARSGSASRTGCRRTARPARSRPRRPPPSEPSPPAIPSTSASGLPRHLGEVVSLLEDVDGDAPLARGVAELLGARRVRAGAWVDDEE